VLGAGKMGGALVRGWVGRGVVRPELVAVANRRSETAEALAREIGITAAGSPAEAVTDADVLLIGVKPPLVAPVLAGVRDRLPSRCLVLSVAAGIRLATLQEVLLPATRIIRVMPNTPSLVGEGAAGFCRGATATDADAALVTRLFGAVGKVAEVTEEQLDAVIGVSGSGVAYFYLLIEALTDGGVRAGLPRDVARTLAAQTARGAATMILETGEHPAALKDAVTTPGGTTIAALEVLEKAAVRGTMIAAVLAARDRAREMG
jgi:pyrroline-5-carboxylate reductase